MAAAKAAGTGAGLEAENCLLTMRSEEKENFRPVSPMMMAYDML